MLAECDSTNVDWSDPYAVDDHFQNCINNAEEEAEEQVEEETESDTTSSFTTVLIAMAFIPILIGGLFLSFKLRS